MDFVYTWARSYHNKPILPKTLWDKFDRANFIDFVDKELFSGIATWQLDPVQLDSLRTNIELKTSTYIDDVQDPLDRFVITAVLWSGCITGAKAFREMKVMAIEDTPAGKKITESLVTSEDRMDISNMIERNAIVDELYRLGVEACPVLCKNIRGQEIFHDGIPENSILMKILKDYLQ
jgi:hypothetical protein